MPDFAPISPCTSEESSSSAGKISVTGEWTDIERKYRVDPRVLGAGQHGPVRECTDRATGRRRAVKSIRKGGSAAESAGIAREISLLRGTKHPGIIRLVDVFEDSERVRIVTDLCAGGELFDRIVRRSSDRDDDGVPCHIKDIRIM